MTDGRDAVLCRHRGARGGSMSALGTMVVDQAVGFVAGVRGLLTAGGHALAALESQLADERPDVGPAQPARRASGRAHSRHPDGWHRGDGEHE